MDLIKNVFDISEEFIKKRAYVFIQKDKIEEVAESIKKDLKNYKNHWLGYPECIKNGKERHKEYELVAYELIANSINYCYWYCKYDIRPNNSSSTLMYQLLDESFEEARPVFTGSSSSVCYDAVSIFIKKISLYRFPNLENRVKHLKEIRDSIKRDGIDVINTIAYKANKSELSVEELIEIIVANYSGYAGDMFLKRVFLFVMMLYRRVGWFKDEIYKIPIPADYQIPKMLNYLGCIEYLSPLREKIKKQELILPGSIIECEIRATSIIACRELAEKAECTSCNIDNYLWLKRKECKEPFHLTITTDY